MTNSMMGPAAEMLLDITITTPLSSPEPELQRGRKRRRDFLEVGVGVGRTTIPSSESATFRGRCRYRSSSRYLDVSSLSRPTSQHRMMAGPSHYRNTSASPSPSRRKLIRITQLARDGPRSSRSPPRSSRSPYAYSYGGLGVGGAAGHYVAKRRRQRTPSRSRGHAGMSMSMPMPVGFEAASRGEEVKIAAVEALVLPLTKYEPAVPGDLSTAGESGGQG
ncbi:hypothetical protein GGR51DRAFT_565802 [Nemania sp. FL0031]|nr:hypothetical protein GGR51DRAFT_565802 [Nemania sp. FL0031]